jgi:hypothetical protein
MNFAPFRSSMFIMAIFDFALAHTPVYNNATHIQNYEKAVETCHAERRQSLALGRAKGKHPLSLS